MISKPGSPKESGFFVAEAAGIEVTIKNETGARVGRQSAVAVTIRETARIGAHAGHSLARVVEGGAEGLPGADRVARGCGLARRETTAGFGRVVYAFSIREIYVQSGGIRLRIRLYRLDYLERYAVDILHLGGAVRSPDPTTRFRSHDAAEISQRFNGR